MLNKTKVMTNEISSNSCYTLCMTNYNKRFLKTRIRRFPKTQIVIIKNRSCGIVALLGRVKTIRNNIIDKINISRIIHISR